MVNILAFAGHRVSHSYTQSCRCRTRASTDNIYMMRVIVPQLNFIYKNKWPASGHNWPLSPLVLQFRCNSQHADGSHRSSAQMLKRKLQDCETVRLSASHSSHAERWSRAWAGFKPGLSLASSVTLGNLLNRSLPRCLWNEDAKQRTDVRIPEVGSGARTASGG